MTSRPDLTNSDEHLPILAGDSAPYDPAGEAMIRSLANRHGHTRLPRRTGGWVEICPDPQAHARDVKAMARVLEACGYVPYEPGRPDVTPDGCRRTTVNYRRP